MEQALAEARRTGKPVEAASATTATAKSIANPDGTVSLTQSALPARKRVNGAWEDLDATLIRNADGTLSPKVGLEPLRLSSGGDSPMAVLGDSGINATIGAPMALPEPSVSGATATYADVLPDVDLLITALPVGGFSEVFVVHDADAAQNPALAELVLPTQTSGLTLATDAAGNITGIDRVGHTVLSAPTPMMWDSATPAPQASAAKGVAPATGAGSSALSTARGPGSAARTARLGVAVRSGRIAVTPDKKLLTGAKTTYPVYIDPSFTWSTAGGSSTGWATVAAQYATTNYWKSTPDPGGLMQVGYSGQIKSRTFVNFSIPTSTLAGADINTATFKITEVWSYSCTPSRINVYAPASTLSPANAYWGAWANYAFGSAVDYADVAYGHDDGCKANAIPFDVKSAVTADVTAGKTTQTFALIAGDESSTVGWKEFLQTSPTLYITYNHKPDTPTGMTTSPATSCTAATPTMVGQGDVMLYAPVNDRDRSAVGVQFQLWKDGAAGTILAFTNPSDRTYDWGRTAVLRVAMSTLDSAAGNSGVTTFDWNVRVTDFNRYSDWSTTCRFRYDKTRPGQPSIDPIQDGTAQIAVPITVPVNPPSGILPTSYLYQLNGGPYGTVTATTSGTASITITPTRFTNTLSVTSMSTGGNVGGAAQITFNALPAADAPDGDFTGDGIADLITAGGANKLPPGLWAATGRGTGQVAPIAANLGAHGNGDFRTDDAAGNPVGNPSDFTGAQILTGHFGGSGLQDVFAYYPVDHPSKPNSIGSGVILRGNGDGSVIQAELTPTYVPVRAMMLWDDMGNTPLQLINAGAIRDPYLPDLLGVGGNSTSGFYLYDLPSNGAPGSFGNPTPLVGQLTPTGGTDWNTWTLTSAQTTNGTALLLWQANTGKLYLWNNLTYTDGNTVLTYNQYLLSTSFKTGETQTLRAADVDGNGTTDLWTINTNGEATGWLISGLANGAGTIAAQPWQALTPPTHTWKLDDAKDGAIGPGQAKDSAGTLHAGAPTAAVGVSWNGGDLFNPDAEFGAEDTIANIGISTTGNAVTTNADFSVAAWVKPAAYDNIVIAQDGAVGTSFKIWPASDGTWRFGMQKQDVASSGALWDIATSATGTAKLGVWYHITATYKASTGKMMLYVNDQLGATATHTSPWSAGNSFRIGDTQTTAPAHAGFFKGQIAMVQTWNIVVWPVPELQDAVWDRVRTSAGWTPTPAMIDSNPLIISTATTRAPDGSIHIFNMVPGSGIWWRMRSPEGVWQPGATRIDTNGTITDVAAAALPDGSVHVQALVPGSGIWDRTRSTAGAWSGSTQIDAQGALTAVASAALPNGTLHVLTLYAGFGVYDRTRSTAGAWSAANRFDTNGSVSAIAAAGLTDGTLHAVTLLPGTGLYDHILASNGTWNTATRYDTNGGLQNVSAAAGPDGSLHVDFASSGTSVYHRYRSPAGVWDANATSFVTPAQPVNLTSWIAPDGNPHVTYIPNVT